VAAVDLLVPYIGELAGGSLREERMPELIVRRRVAAPMDAGHGGLLLSHELAWSAILCSPKWSGAVYLPSSWAGTWTCGATARCHMAALAWALSGSCST